MGEHDIPANLNFIKDANPNKRVTYIGYAQGATSMLYGLSLKEKAVYFRQLVDEVVLLAPCVFLDTPDHNMGGQQGAISMSY